MARSAAKLTPLYGLHADDITIDTAVPREYPVTVDVQHLKGAEATGETSTIRAKYVVGADGVAQRRPAQAIGRELAGDATNQSWGVLDVLAVTDFPRHPAQVRDPLRERGQHPDHPAGGRVHGAALRRAGQRCATRRCWRTAASRRRSWSRSRNRMLHPYTLELKDVGWWSVYSIGQRLCDKFDDVPVEEMPDRLPRVFIAGDACHTHSAKAGQGMNVSMADTWNLGWKLASVLRGTARPELLHTYSDERQKIAAQLIDFDREFAKMFSAHPTDSGDADGEGVDPEEFQQYFITQGRFTAGVATKYAPSMITRRAAVRAPRGGLPGRDAVPLRPGRPGGRRQAGAPRATPPGRTAPGASTSSPTGHRPVAPAASCARSWSRTTSPITRFTPAGADPDSVIDVRADLPAGPPRRRRRRAAVGAAAQEGPVRPGRLREDVLPRPRPATSSTCAGSTATPAASWSSARTSTSRTCSRWTAHDELAEFFAGILVDAQEATPLGVVR